MEIQLKATNKSRALRVVKVTLYVAGLYAVGWVIGYAIGSVIPSVPDSDIGL